MSSSSSISVSYDLRPPTEVDGLKLTPLKTQQFQIKSSATEGQKKYYEGLRVAVAEAKSWLGEDLTAWRDAVGNAEQSKENKKTLKYDVDEVDDEDEDVQQS